MYGSIHNISAFLLIIRVHEMLTMKTDSCVEITDAKRIEMKSGLAEPGEHRNSGFIISAFILIGLGVGLLVDHLGSGFLIGLGLGFVSSELLPRVMKSLKGEGSQSGEANATTLLIGVFLIIIGTGSVLAPAAIWPYAIAGFLILFGLWILVRGYSQ
jgi:hypothetical protein